MDRAEATDQAEEIDEPDRGGDDHDVDRRGRAHGDVTHSRQRGLDAPAQRVSRVTG